MRRKGVPCGCTDNGGCCGLKEKLAILWDRTIGSILKINDQTPDGDGKFRILEGDNIEITDVSNGIRVGVDPTQDLTLQADLTVDGDIVANGDIIQNGSAYETHAEKIYTNDDYIVMREGAVGPLASGDYSGFQVTKYDGTNDGRLVIDRDGVARVGDVGDEQPLATRDESADLTDDHLLKWDATNQKLVDAGISAGSVGGFELVNANAHSYLPVNPGDDETVTITTGPFEAGYDYFLYIFYAGGENANIRGRYDTQTVGTTGVDLKIQASAPMSIYSRLYRTASNDPLPGTSVRLNTISAPSTNAQEKLVSGTNIKTVGGQSILGSGDIPAGGLVWTERANNQDWSDLFDADINNLKVTAKKNIVMYDTIAPSFPPVFIPKGFTKTGNTGIVINYPTYGGTGSVFYISAELRIAPDRIASYQSFNVIVHNVTLTTDGSTVTATNGTQTSYTYKYQFKVWYAD